jgi:phenylacetate-CoA ligase
LVFKPELSWEFLSADEIEVRSIRAVRNHVKYVKEVSPYYREILQTIEPEEIRSVEDLQQLPFTNKDVLALQANKFLGVHPDHIVESVITSGSTGKPLVFGLTQSDLDRLAFNEALSFHSTGITSQDRAHLLVSMDRLFIAGMAYYRGLILLGANTMRLGVLPNEMHKIYFEMLQPTVLVGVPSFLKKLAIELDKLKFDTRKSSIKKIICIGESLRNQNMELNSTANTLQELWNAKVYSTYASTELSVSYCECEEQCGGHAHPELAYTEIVDDQGNPVENGTPGELVVTPLGVEGMPLVRFKTGDITCKISEPCACGRNSIKIGPILGRKSQMIKLKGTTVYPLTITNALDEINEINDYVIILENDDALSDRVAIHVAVAPTAIEKIANHLRAVARVNFPILVSNINTIQSFRGDSRKKTRIIDWRQQFTKK